jgi:hypothetical protein
MDDKKFRRGTNGWQSPASVAAQSAKQEFLEGWRWWGAPSKTVWGRIQGYIVLFALSGIAVILVGFAALWITR